MASYPVVALRPLTYAPDMTESDEAHSALQVARQLHTEDRLGEAIVSARRALEIDPDFVEALSYLGNTLVTRKRRYREGLALLERARDLAPVDPYSHYTLGWCYEFAAHELAGLSAPSGVPPVPVLYRLAAAELRSCLCLHPEDDLRNDVEKLLDQITDRLKNEG